jgi:hypothetical protein
MLQKIKDFLSTKIFGTTKVENASDQASYKIETPTESWPFPVPKVTSAVVEQAPVVSKPTSEVKEQIVAGVPTARKPRTKPSVEAKTAPRKPRAKKVQ